MCVLFYGSPFASERAPEIFFFCLFTLFLAVCSGCGRPSCRTAQISVSLQVNCEIFPLTLQSYERETRAVLQIGKFLRAATMRATHALVFASGRLAHPTGGRRFRVYRIDSIRRLEDSTVGGGWLHFSRSQVDRYKHSRGFTCKLEIDR